MQATYNTTQNTISIKPAAPVDAATFSRLRAAGFAWKMDAGAFVAMPANELARGVAADIAGSIETTQDEAEQASGEDEAEQASGEDEAAPELCDDIERATYSPEDNKIRLYPARRLDPETYARIKAAGFAWAPKQCVFVAPKWTPARADIAQALAGDIEDEDSTLAERADARADRFEDYSDKRAGEAEQARAAVSAIAENIPFGQPILVGHHSEKRARKDAQRIENGMRYAVKMWETSEYWTRRAAGAIAHAKYKELPGVRARRIKTIEADQRKQQRTLDRAEKFRAAWHADGLKPGAALKIANYEHISRCFSLADYPRAAPASQYEGSIGLWSALDGGIITAEQARDIAIISHARTISHARRWIDHQANRITYERAMLAESGGLQTDQVKPEKGGAIRCLWAPRGGWAWIVKVNTITVSILHNYGNGGRNFKHNVPLDKIREVMSAADVEAARAAGRLVETGDQVGFFLAEPTTPDEDTAESAQASGEDVTPSGEAETPAQNIAAIIPDPTPAPEPAPVSSADAFAAMRDSLRAGVQIVAAPQLFPTPAGLAARMVELADIPPGACVLEPSAGTGRILEAIRDAWPVGKAGRPIRTAVEVDGRLCDRLEVSEAGALIVRGDFLAMDAGRLGTFERVIMNPPFVNGADIKHIQHAAGLLKPGGRLVALCANGPRQREQLQPLASHWEDLPAGSFAESGTGVNVALLVIDAPAATGTDDDRAAVQASGEAPAVPTSGEDAAEADYLRVQDISAADARALSAAEYERLNQLMEDANAHSENVIFQAKRYGTAWMIAEARAILAAHMAAGYLTPALRTRRDSLARAVERVQNLAESSTPAADPQPTAGAVVVPFVATWFYTGLVAELTAAGWVHEPAQERISSGRFFVFDRNSQLGSSGDGWAEWRIFLNAWNAADNGGGWAGAGEIDAQGKTPQQVAADIVRAAASLAQLWDGTKQATASAPAPAVQASGEQKPVQASGEYHAPTYPSDRNARELVRAVEAVDLLKRFAYLKPLKSEGKTGAAVNIRIELKRAFPAIKFSVRTERSSTINIEWTDGPSADQVEAISNKYSAGHFDGMTDCYNYASNGFTDTFGDARYIFTRRNFTDDVIAATLASIAAYWGADLPSVEDYRQGRLWNWQNRGGADISREMHRALVTLDCSVVASGAAVQA